MEQRLKAIGEAAPRRCEMCNRFPVNGVAQASRAYGHRAPQPPPAPQKCNNRAGAPELVRRRVHGERGVCGRAAWRLHLHPPMINNAAAWQLAKSVAATIVGAERVQEADATMGGEDFGYFMRHIPGVFVLIGSGSEPLGTTHGVHTPLFKLDEFRPVHRGCHARDVCEGGAGAAASGAAAGVVGGGSTHIQQSTQYNAIMRATFWRVYFLALFLNVHGLKRLCT